MTTKCDIGGVTLDVTEHPLLPQDPFWTPGKVISGLIVICYMALAIATGGEQECLEVVLFSVLPIACIWFPEVLGDYTGYAMMRGPAITSGSPPGCVSVIGWLLLLLPVVQIGIILWDLL